MNKFYNNLNSKNQVSYMLETQTIKNLNIDIGSSYFIKGVPDSGKTTLALQIARAWIDETAVTDKIHFVPSLRVTELLRAWYSAKSGSQSYDVWRYEYESYRDSLCLIIDDFGKEKVTEFVFEKWYELLNYRNENGLQTIFTSNESLETIAKNFDDSVRSRIFAIIGNPETNVIKLEYKGYRIKSTGNKTDFSKLKKIVEPDLKINQPKKDKTVEVSEAIQAMIRGYTQAKQYKNPDWTLDQATEIKETKLFRALALKRL